MGDDSQQEEDQKRGSFWLAILPVGLFAALAVVFVFGLKGSKTVQNIPSVLIGKPVPEKDLKPIAGLVIGGRKIPGLLASDLKQGQISIVNFWASWCIPCRQEHPQLIALGKMAGFKLVGINYKDKPDEARGFLKELGSPYVAVGSDFSGRVGIEWGVVGVPETYIVDGKGVIRYKFIGPISAKAMHEDLLPKIKEIAGEKN